jgi:hypothetical protein
LSVAQDTGDGLLSAIGASIHRSVPGGATVSAVAAVEGPAGRHPNVWRVTLADGRRVAAKRQPYAPLVRGRPWDLLEVEKKVCGRLRMCPVPTVLGVDPELSLIYFGWAGDETLDDICQLRNPSIEHGLALKAIEGFSCIQEGFRGHARDLEDRALPGCDADGVRASWQTVKDELLSGLPLVLEAYGTVPGSRERFRRNTARLMDELGAVEPELGVTDYNARNIVVDRPTGAVCFIEFSKIGSDWDERRLVQYTTGMGAGQPGGRFHSLLTRDLVKRLADLSAERLSIDAEEAAGRLDGHHFVFHAMAACRICGALEGRAEDAGRLLDLWANPGRRLRELAPILKMTLSDHPIVRELRSCFDRTQAATAEGKE